MEVYSLISAETVPVLLWSRSADELLPPGSAASEENLPAGVEVRTRSSQLRVKATLEGSNQNKAAAVSPVKSIKQYKHISFNIVILFLYFFGSLCRVWVLIERRI